MKKIFATSLIGFFSLTMAGCIATSSDELLQAPKLPTDYMALQNKIDAKTAEGMVLISPDSGTYRNSLQLRDLDADTHEEAIAFFRKSNISNEFEIVVYERELDDYVEVGTIYGEGTGIYSVDYLRLAPIGGVGISVSWSVGDKTQKGLTIVKYEENELKTFLNTTYEHMFLLDVDKDGIDEVFIINREEEKMLLKMYRSDGDKMLLETSVLLSSDTDSISKITIGELVSGGIAIAIDSRVVDRSGLITDFITYDQGQLINITIDETNSSAFKTYRVTNSTSSKIFGTNIIYVPTVSGMKDSVLKEPMAVSYITNWNLFDNYNPTTNDIFTYHNTLDGWYFNLTDMYKENIVLNKSAIASSQITTFSYFIDENNIIELFEVYMIPKEDFNNEAFGNGYINLADNTNNVYVAKNLNPKSEFALTNEEIIENFKIIGS